MKPEMGDGTPLGPVAAMTISGDRRGFARPIQAVDLAANHLQDPVITVWHYLDHLLSLVISFQHIANSDVGPNSKIFELLR